VSPVSRRPPGAGSGEGSRAGAASERMMLMRAFGETLQRLRGTAGLTPDGLAERCRLPVKKLVDTEVGRVEPSLRLILVLCEGLAIAPDELLGGLPVPQERGSI
jgi:transcriptional regulator with XRE-family HTH domain